MNLLPFTKPQPYRTRAFVPKKIDLGDWPQIAALFDKLESRIAGCKTAAQLQRWVLDAGELSAALEEESSLRNIAMTCHTDHPDAEKAYLHFVEKIEPEAKPRQFTLAQLYLAHPQRARLPKKRWFVFDRNAQLQVELFRPENVGLETEESRLGQQYQKLSGSLTVQFRGEEKTLPQMGPYLEQTDRALRQEAWELTARRRLQEADKFEGLFEQMLKLREQIAVNTGYRDYLTYAFRARGRFDYTPKDCQRFHDAVEKEIMPIVRKLQGERRSRLGLDALRPWDMAVDPLNRAPLRPFATVDDMVKRTQRIFDQLDPRLAADFKLMRRKKLLDLDNRKGKAPGGYQSTLSEARLPFIFMNAVGIHRDVETILHEAGHAFHALATQKEDLHVYRSAPIEFCEVASMSMELLGNEFIEAFYAAPEARRARHDHLEQVITIFPWIVTVDAFQHWIYSHPGHSREERQAAWVDLMKRFGGDVDWSGHEEKRANLWHRQLHIFLYPFYYIEYGIAQLGALQVWANSLKNKRRALQQYQRALGLGGSRPLPELFASAGCHFDFSRKTIHPLVRLVREQLEKVTGVEEV